MKNFICRVVCLLVVVVSPCFGQVTTKGTDKRISTWVVRKNVPLLELISSDKMLSRLLKKDAELVSIANAKQSDVTASKDCSSLECLKKGQIWSNAQIANSADLLVKLLVKNGYFNSDNIIGIALHGKYQFTGTISNAEKLKLAFIQDMSVLNHIINVYGFGAKPNYPTIDSITFNVNTKEHLERIKNAGIYAFSGKKKQMFFEPTLKLAMEYLTMNGRLNAGFYEPMALGVNKEAVGAVNKVDFSKFPYSHILVPGIGPDDLSIRISDGGKEHCRLAVAEYQKGLAPFLIVSGGNAHPFKTPYNEAEEMKRYLMDSLNVPEKAIIMEPHARHTTTNLRNAARLVFTYGLPTDKPGLIVTDSAQSAYIDKMEKRCIRELGYVPYSLGKRISTTASEYYPLRISFRIDPDEPLDP